MRTITLITATLALSVVSGCMVDSGADFPSQEELYDSPSPLFKPEHRAYNGFILAAPRGEAIAAQITDSSIVGFDMHLGRYVNLGRYLDPEDRSIRGVAFGQRVDLKVEGERVHGVLDGTIPLDVTATREDGSLHVRGLVRGFPADFRLDDDRLAGTFGRCSYALDAMPGQVYQGALHCKGFDRLVLVKVPPELTRWTDAEMGAALGLLLGGR
jgi:hypothetical protein